MCGDDAEAQGDEVTALASIYEERVFVADGNSGGQYSAYLELPEEFLVRLEGPLVQQAKENGLTLVEEARGSCLLHISHLPPIVLNFQFPKDYPSTSAPSYTVSCKWLSVAKLSSLCAHLDAIWEESCGEVVIFQWIQFLQEESLQVLDVVSPLALDFRRVLRSSSVEACRIEPPDGDGGEGSAGRQRQAPGASDPPTRQGAALGRGSEKGGGEAAGKGDSESGGTEDLMREDGEKGLPGQCRASGANASTPRTCQAAAADGEPQPTAGAKDQGKVAEEGEEDLDLDPRAVQDVGSASLLLRTLIEYDRAERQRVFDASYYSCLVCFGDKAGADCVHFRPCDHVYCKDCIREYFRVQIQEGNVKALVCPDTECNSPALPSQVHELVGTELFATYDRLLLQRTLDCMDDIVYCPRVTCQCPVMRDKESAIAVCSACSFPFCIKCRMAYHGISPCRLKKEEILKLRQEYEEGSDEARAKLEVKFGRRLFLAVLEEFESQRWKDENSKECPRCHTNIEKIDGCNKMVCSQCRTFFCWLCCKILPSAVPYRHFNDPRSACFNKLFNAEGPGHNNMVYDDWLLVD